MTSTKQRAPSMDLGERCTSHYQTSSGSLQNLPSAKVDKFLLNASNQIASAAPHPLPFTPLKDLIAANQLALRTYAIRSNDFKRNLDARALPTAIRREYRLARLPRFTGDHLAGATGDRSPNCGVSRAAKSAARNAPNARAVRYAVSGYLRVNAS